MAAVAVAMLAWWAWPEGSRAIGDRGVIPSPRTQEAARVAAAPRRIATPSVAFAPATISSAEHDSSAHLGTYPTRPFVARVGEEEGASDDAQSASEHLPQQGATPPPARLARPEQSEGTVASDATEQGRAPRRYTGEGAADDEASRDE
jgi:hypothetical protein